MSEKKHLKPYAPGPFSRQLAQSISALEGLHLSTEMQSKFIDFDAKGLTGNERRAQLFALFENN